MAIQTALWSVGPQPQQLVESTLPTEGLLEDMIVANPRLLSDEWMLIGRQADTGFGGRIDLIAIAPDGGLVLIELKRDRTPREVVAQALDYASWVEKLQPADIAEIFYRFSPENKLAEQFHLRFGTPLIEESLNTSHQIVIVAAALDASSERIVSYLSARDIAINVLCFQVFSHGDQQLLSRSWLIDPLQTQVSGKSPADGPSEPWNGEFYCSFGMDLSKLSTDDSRSWEDAVEYGFVSAGGGAWYTRTMRVLKPNDRIWVKIPGVGFVGVGRVMGPSQSIEAFRVQTAKGEVPILEAPIRANYHREWAKDPEKCEYFVPIKWLNTRPVSNPIDEVGLFGNQNTIAKPTVAKWRTTIEYLKKCFPNFDAEVNDGAVVQK